MPPEEREPREDIPHKSEPASDVPPANPDPSAQSHEASGGGKVTARETGAKRDSFFKKRDYE